MKKYSKPQAGVKMSGQKTRPSMPVCTVLPEITKPKKKDIINHKGEGLDSFNLDDTKLS